MEKVRVLIKKTGGFKYLPKQIAYDKKLMDSYGYEVQEIEAPKILSAEEEPELLKIHESVPNSEPKEVKRKYTKKK